jgi:hypothetical protein
MQVAGRVFRPIIFLNSAYLKVHSAVGIENVSPDIFMFTDYFPRKNHNFLRTGIIFSDDRTTIQVIELEILANQKIHFIITQTCRLINDWRSLSIRNTTLHHTSIVIPATSYLCT